MSAQLALIQTIQKTTINYEHVPILKDNKGEKLSKRNSSNGISFLKSKGMTAAGVIGLLASTLKMVPKGSELTCDELLAHLKQQKKGILNTTDNVQPTRE